MKTLPTVCLDVDGVVADFLAAVRAELLKADSLKRPEGWQDVESYPARLSHQTGAQYDCFDAALSAWLWPRVGQDPTWWFRVPVLPEANPKRVGTLVRHLKGCAEVLWVTSRQSRVSPAGKQTANWLKVQGFDDQPSVVACRSVPHKIAVLRALAPVAVIEDHPEILAALGKPGPLPFDPQDVPARYAPPWPYCSGLPGVITLPVIDALAKILRAAERAAWAGMGEW